VNLPEKSVVKVLAFLFSIGLRFHKVDWTLRHSEWRQEDAVECERGLLHFLRPKCIGARSRVSIANQLEEDTGSSLEDFVKE
jgi:hypothetical protein